MSSAPAIPKIHPVFSTQSQKLSTLEENDPEIEYKDGAFSIDAAISQQAPQQQQQLSSDKPSSGQAPRQQPPPQGWTVRALYDFEGQSEFQELSFAAGDELTVVKVGLAEGWSLAEKNGVRGLVPEAYITVSSPLVGACLNTPKNSLTYTLFFRPTSVCPRLFHLA
jgi:sorting nexin-9/18/33